MISNLFTLRDLSFCYPTSAERALNAVNLEISDGEFLVFTGDAGSGKSTILRALAGYIPNCTGGRISGEIYYRHRLLSTIPERDFRSEVTLLMQEPERQSILSVVERELSFAPANIALPLATIKRRVIEVSSLLGIGHLLNKATSGLSSGEKQKVALGSLLTVAPRVLCLDEPTSQLSPMSSTDLVSSLISLNRNHGQTILIAEHNWADLIPFADRIAHLDNGTISFIGSGTEYLKFLAAKDARRLPCLWRKESNSEDALNASSVREMRQVYLKREARYVTHSTVSHSHQQHTKSAKSQQTVDVIVARKLCYAYPNEQLPAISPMNITFKSGSVTCLIGENGAGKSTLLSLIAGTLAPTRGTISLPGAGGERDVCKLSVKERSRLFAYHSAASARCFLTSTIQDELATCLFGPSGALADGTLPESAAELAEGMRLFERLTANPHDLSAGDRHIFSMILALARKTGILLLDEPTRACSQLVRLAIIEAVRIFTKKGGTVICATHDLEFASESADTVFLLHRGELIDSGPPATVLSGNLYFSSAHARAMHGISIPGLGVRSPEVVNG